MGHHVKLISFPASMTVQEFEELLTANNLLSAHDNNKYYNQNMLNDIEKFKGRAVKVGYGPDNKVRSYSVIEVDKE
jgi:hypothetical protein